MDSGETRHEAVGTWFGGALVKLPSSAVKLTFACNSKPPLVDDAGDSLACRRLLPLPKLDTASLRRFAGPMFSRETPTMRMGPAMGEKNRLATWVIMLQTPWLQTLEANGEISPLWIAVWAATPVVGCVRANVRTSSTWNVEALNLVMHIRTESPCLWERWNSKQRLLRGITIQ